MSEAGFAGQIRLWRRFGWVRAVVLFLFPPLWLIIALPLFGEENWLAVFIVALVAIAIGAGVDMYRRFLYRGVYASLAEMARSTPDAPP